MGRGARTPSDDRSDSMGSRAHDDRSEAASRSRQPPMRARAANDGRADFMGSNDPFCLASTASMERQLAGNGNGDTRGDLAEFLRVIRSGDVASPVPLDVATKGAVCKRGHALEEAVLKEEEPDEPCPECGADVMTECPRCGLHFGMGEERADVGPSCAHCGEAFPWSAEARRARRKVPFIILGTVTAGATIIASMLYVGTFLD